MDKETRLRISKLKVLNMVSRAKTICDFHGWDLDWFIKTLEAQPKTK